MSDMSGFEEQFRTPSDDTSAQFRRMAQLNREYYAHLIAVGFDPDQAFELVSDYHTAILAAQLEVDSDDD